jgi:hypothetical protein
MSKFLLTLCAFGLFLSSALAQEKSIEELDKRSGRIMAVEGLQKERVNRVVASGAKQRIGFFTALNPDCTSSGEVSVRITKQPEHGTTETAATTSFPSYPKENLRARCNEHKVRGQQVYYKSAEKYVGDDELELLILFPAGFAWEVQVGISVR